MRPSLLILSTLKQSLDNDLPAGTISGEIFLETLHEPNGDSNIVLNVLSNPGTYVQRAIVNLNVYLQGFSKDVPKLGEFHDIIQALVPLLDNRTHYVGGVTLFTDIADDKGIFKDNDNEGSFFYNLRINCITL